MDIEAEIRDLKRRVGELEGSFGFLTEQVRGAHKDLLTFEAKTDERFDGIDDKLRDHDARFDRLETKIDSVDRKIDTKIDGLAKALPAIVGDAMREVRREERGKS